MPLMMVMVVVRGEVRVESRLLVTTEQVRLEPVISPFSTPGGGEGYDTSATSEVGKQSDPVERGGGRV